MTAGCGMNLSWCESPNSVVILGCFNKYFFAGRTTEVLKASFMIRSWKQTWRFTWGVEYLLHRDPTIKYDLLYVTTIAP